MDKDINSYEERMKSIKKNSIPLDGKGEKKKKEDLDWELIR